MEAISRDWEPVVICKKLPTAAARKDEKVVNAARRAGAEIETVRMSAAGTNKASKSTITLNTGKLDEITNLELPGVMLREDQGAINVAPPMNIGRGSGGARRY